MASEARYWRIGVDEAGYGPNLGPLVVAATAWRAPPGDLYELLSNAVSSAADAERIQIADSKTVYQSGDGLQSLERGVYAFLGPPASYSELLERLQADPTEARRRSPWLGDFDTKLPLDVTTEQTDQACEQLDKTRQQADVGPVLMLAHMVLPEEFNELLKTHGTKGAALSFVSIGLASQLANLATGKDERIEFTFDKHGGRNRYGALLQEHFSDGWVETLVEGRASSRYRLGDRMTFEFRTGGEAVLPVALASMTAKLLRELSMKAFNEYWAREVPGVRPTAGYPVDAKRFRTEIATRQAELEIPDHVLWRER